MLNALSYLLEPFRNTNLLTVLLMQRSKRVGFGLQLFYFGTAFFALRRIDEQMWMVVTGLAAGFCGWGSSADKTHELALMKTGPEAKPGA